MAVRVRVSVLDLIGEFVTSEYSDVLNIFKKIRPDQKGAQLVISVGGNQVWHLVDHHEG